jgi:geranylgeranyl diphosphate synthase type II
MLPQWYSLYKKFINWALTSYVNNYFDNACFKELDELKKSTRYAIKWWKRIRSILALEFYLFLTNKDLDDIDLIDDIVYYCIAIELLHAYSLVHDDLPCIDNDTYRRWKPTVWMKFSEQTAVFTWDLLNTMAFEVLWYIKNKNILSDIILNFWSAVWLNWLIWWQILDIYFEDHQSKLSLSKLRIMHNKKTWELINVSILWAILIADHNEQTKRYSVFWKKLGLAYQIKDDILDNEWTLLSTWKSVWWEQKWFVHFLWLNKSKKLLDDLIKECHDLIRNNFSERISFLIDYIGKRKK